MIYTEEQYNQLAQIAGEHKQDAEIYEGKYYDLQKTHEQLKKQLATTKKALQLACKFMSDYCIPCPPLKDCPAVACHKDKKDCYYRYFINQAKENKNEIDKR